MDTHWFSKHESLTKALRFAGAALMVASAFGPLAVAPVPTAQAKNLEWGDVRPPLTTDDDSDEAGGFAALPTFGTTTHAITVASNGDIFVAGGTAGSQKVYRSTNGGKNWRSATVTGATGATIIREIAVSPDYPSDGWIGVVFSDATAADVDNDNGICFATTYPTGGGNIGTCLDTGDGGLFADIRLNTIALSPDFNWSNGNGELAIGGQLEAGATTVYIAQVSALKSTPAVADFIATVDATAGAGDYTLHLAYTADEEPIALARIFVAAGAATYGEIHQSTGWAGTGSAAILDSLGAACVAVDGQVGFDDEFSAGGSFFAAVSCAGAPIGGVYRFGGSTWANKTVSDGDCNQDFSSLHIGGNGSNTKIVAAVNLSNRVCRSTNEASSWSDAEVDGGDDVCNDCGIDASTSITRISGLRSNPSMVYHTGTATLSGVSMSSSTGSNWSDTGLTNLAYTVSSMRELDANKAIAVVAAGGVDALFYTDTYGTGAGWMRVLRTARTDLSFGPGLGDLATSGRTFARFNAATSDKVLITTNGGMTWDDASQPDPFENGPDSNELVVAESVRNGSLAYFGGDKGHVAVTTDGGNSWTVLAKDFGEDVDEFDFTSDATTFFVTGEDTDGVNKIWMTKDSGGTFTQVGGTPWGNGDGGISLAINGFNVADGTGWLIVMTNGDTSTDEVYRLKMPDGQWEDLDLDVTWSDIDMFSTPGVGDGRALVLSAAAGTFYTVWPFTGDKDDMTPTAGADPAKNLLLEIPTPPVFGTLSTARTLPGYTMQHVTGGRVVELTLPTSFTSGPTPSSPINGISVPTNIGDEGVPAILRWNSISGVDEYSVRIGLDPLLDDAFVVAGLTSAQAIIDRPVYALIAGNTYYWQAQVQEAEGSVLESPWSQIASFVVSTTSTQVIAPVPSLPNNGANLPGVATQLSWNNPAGVTQVHIQVTPLNGDGPAINLILNATNHYEVPAPVFGTGPYVMLPGATYTWRLRVSASTTAIGENDSSWGPWSTPWTFTTARPNAGSLQLVSPINGAAITDTTPTVEWKSSNPSDFYYEIQMSSDPNFGEQGIKAAVFHNLIHGGVSTPPNSWTVPDANALPKGQYYWRVRQRVQATPAGAAETGITWSPAQGFVVN